MINSQSIINSPQPFSPCKSVFDSDDYSSSLSSSDNGKKN
jgi:hypothetical protein